jgi:hypothetical protein
MTDPSVWPLARLTIDDDTGETLKASIHAGHNDDMIIEADEGSLVGRTDEGRGPAQRINVVAPIVLQDGVLSLDIEAPLVLQDGVLSIDVEALRALLAE